MAGKRLALLGAFWALFSVTAAAALEPVPIDTIDGWGSASMSYAALNGTAVLTVGCQLTGSASLTSRLSYVAGKRTWEQSHSYDPQHYTIKYNAVCDQTYTATLPNIPSFVAIDFNGSILRNVSLNIQDANSVHLQNGRIYDSPCTTSLSTDGIAVTHSYDVSILRMTLKGNCDSSIDITNGSQNVTVQDSILAEPVNAPPSDPSRPSTNSVVKDMWTQYSDCASSPCAGGGISFIRNLFVGSRTRNPQFEQDDLGGTCTSRSALPSEFVNNVVANWADGRGTVVLNGACVNVVNNVYTNPGGSSNDQQDGVIVCNASGAGSCTGFSDGRAYVSGNELVDQPSFDLNAQNTESSEFSAGLIGGYTYALSACGTGQTSDTVLATAGAKTGGRNTAESTLIAGVTGC